MKRSNVVFRYYLAFGALFIAGYFLLPSAAQNLALIASNLVALTAILFSWRTRKLTPSSGWLLLAAFPAATAVGNTVYFLNDSILQIEPFPSVGDAAFLGGYLFLAAGLLRIQPARSAVRDIRAVLDVAIVTVGFGAASWVYFMAPLLHDPGTPMIERLTAVGYPVADVLVLAVAARFFLTVQRRGPVFGWFAGTVIVMLVADTLFSILNLLGLYATGHLVDVLILAYNLGWGAIALHRDAGHLAESPQPRTQPSWLRLAGLAAACVIPATVLLVQVLTGDLHDVTVTVGAGVVLFILVMIRMMSLVLQLEAALKQRKALQNEVATNTAELNRIASIVTSSREAIVGLSLAGMVTSWNPAAERLYGRRAAEVVNRSQDILAPEQFAAFRSSLDPATMMSDTISQEFLHTRPDGTTVPVAMTISPIRTGDVLTGMSVSGQDVTERRRADTALRRAQAEALEASRLKSEFLATMSHEIRTPMNGVIGLTGLLLQTPLDNVQRQYTQGVQTAGQALLTVINDILDLSKLEADKVDLDRTDFDPQRLVEEVGGLLAREAESKGLELVAYCAPDVPPLLNGDSGRIRQILLNLASNAVKFTSSGEVVIKLEMVHSPDGAALAQFEVADTGIGIPAESHQRLFNAFSQADASTTRRYGGTGLGLAICLRLVEAMDGSIGLESDVGVGSRFWFRLPLGRSDGPQGALPEDTLPAGLRVLVVDDNATSRRILSSQLRSWDVHADAAPDGPSALVELHRAVTDEQPYDIVLLDWCMPGMNGLQLAHAISADESLRHTRSLLLTSAALVDRRDLTEAGVDQWLTKPVGSAALRRQLRLVMTPTPQAAHASPTGSAHQPAPLHQPGVRILVVEDNAMNQLVAESVLAHLGYQPDLAANGVEALAAMSHTTYAAVLMDCHMPVMDGYDATREIRRTEGSGRRTPIIAMTASAMPQDRERALASGMDDYVSKPVVLETMASMLAHWTADQQIAPAAKVVDSIQAGALTFTAPKGL